VDEKKESLVPLKDIISEIFGDSKLPFNPYDGRICKVWEEVVGTAIARNDQPSWIKDRRLRVKVSDPIWLQELEFERENIREKLNLKLGRNAVKKVEFRLGTQ